MPSLFISCGEKSGDLLGAKVIQYLPEFEVEGIIGPALLDAGAYEIEAMEKFEIIGLTEIALSLPRMIPIFRKIKEHILMKQPQAVLMIDNIEFHLLLAKALKKAGYRGKIIQLVCPTIWAWRKHRKKTLEKYFDLLLTLLPFEEKLFEGSTLKARYIGHPLLEELEEPTRTKLALKGKVIALFPGSRSKEIKLALPLFLEAVKPFTDYQIAIAVSNSKLLPEIQKHLSKAKMTPLLVNSEHRHELMRRADFALSKYGTVNLELAYYEVPTINAFPLPPFEQFAFQYLFKVFLPHYSLPNLIAERRIFPEYPASFATTENLQKEIRNFIHNPKTLEWITEGCKDVKRLLGKKKAGETAATEIRNLLR